MDNVVRQVGGWLAVTAGSLAVVGLVATVPTATAEATLGSQAFAGNRTSATVSGPVSMTPASYTPYLDPAVSGQNVRQLVQCGPTVYAVGRISSIKQADTVYPRSSAFSFSATTGVVTGWSPSVDGDLSSVALSPDCSTAYLAGDFSTVNGESADNVVAVNTTTGAVIEAFAHSASAHVDTLQFVHGQVVAGGQFTSINGAKRSRMASLDATTGLPTKWLKLAFAGKYPRSSPTKVYNSQLSHDGTRLLIEGVFTTIATVPRQQVAVLDLGSTSVSLNGWHAPELDAQCMPVESFYAKGGNWSADDSQIYVVSTGYKPNGGSTSAPRSGLCDSAAAFPATATDVKHDWINYTGCDSLYSVVADASTVYIGGHERWSNNPLGCDRAGTGAVAMPGIGGLGVTDGLATSWNPTRFRGHGAEDLLLTNAGLWVASDNAGNGSGQACGGKPRHGGICFFPYNPYSKGSGG